MNITAIATPVEDQLVDIVVVPYFENSDTLTGSAKKLDTLLKFLVGIMTKLRIWKIRKGFLIIIYESSAIITKIFYKKRTAETAPFY